MTKVSRGRKVRVYQKPITGEQFEGIAVIQSVYRNDYDKETKLHLVTVLFTEDMVGGGHEVARRVKASDIVDEY